MRGNLKTERASRQCGSARFNASGSTKVLTNAAIMGFPLTPTLPMNPLKKFPLTPTPLPEERGTSERLRSKEFRGAMREHVRGILTPALCPRRGRIFGHTWRS